MLGTIVHFRQAGQCKAALVVKQWSDECVNLQVFEPLDEQGHFDNPVQLKTSMLQGTEDCNWHLSQDCDCEV